MEVVIEKIDNLKERFDVNYYKNEYTEIDKKLKKSKYQIKVLKDIAKIKGGKRIPKESSFSNIKNDYPYIRVVDFKDFSVNFEKIKYINKSVFDKIKNYTISKEDIYLSNAGTIGLVGIIPNELNNKSLTENALKITELKRDIVKQRFLMCLLSLNIIQKKMEQETLIVGVPKLSLNRVSSLELPIPPINIQEKVIKIFDKALNNKQKKEKEAKELIDSIDRYMLKELGIQEPKLTEKMTFKVKINDLLNNRLDVEYHKGMYKKINMYIKNSIFTTRKVKNIVEYMKTGAEVNVKNYLDFGKYFFINVSNVSNLKIDIEKNIKAINEKTYLDNIENRPNKNEILFTKYGSIGNVAMVENEDNITVGTHILRIKIINSINNYFLLYLLNSNIFRSLVKSLKKGGVIPRIDIRDIENFDIPIPPKSVQDKIAKEVKKRLDKAHKLKEEGNRGFEKAKLEIENILLS